MGVPELHGDAYDLAQASPRQSVHSRARLLRGPTGRWTLRTGRAPCKRGQRSGFMKLYIRFDSFGRNKLCLSCGLHNGFVAMRAWNLHAGFYAPLRGRRGRRSLSAHRYVRPDFLNKEIIMNICKPNSAHARTLISINNAPSFIVRTHTSSRDSRT
jgi:hypothetical protein